MSVTTYVSGDTDYTEECDPLMTIGDFIIIYRPIQLYTKLFAVHKCGNGKYVHCCYNSWQRHKMLLCFHCKSPAPDKVADTLSGLMNLMDL